jgi:16S rRNA (adenine(1408)-N(1))-methyltransferase
MDIGTGDGRAVLERAAAWPRDLVLGIDASATAMARSSNRARRRGPANARFFVSAAEVLPPYLAGVAALVSITMPWGSLLRGVLGQEEAVLRGIAGVLAPHGRVVVLTSVVESDGVPGLPHLDDACREDLATAWARAGLELLSMRPATPEEVRGSGSSWARRLGDRTTSRLDGRPLGAAESG